LPSLRVDLLTAFSIFLASTEALAIALPEGSKISPIRAPVDAVWHQHGVARETNTENNTRAADLRRADLLSTDHPLKWVQFVSKLMHRLS
jgi:hypothetical protein